MASLALLQLHATYSFRNRGKTVFKLSWWYHMCYARVWELHFYCQLACDACALIPVLLLL